MEDLSQRDIDILTLGSKEVMQKYNLEKQPVYDRRFALNKKIRAAGLSIEQVLGNININPDGPKKGRAKENGTTSGSSLNQSAKGDQDRSNGGRIEVGEKQTPAVQRPVEISIDGYLIKLNGVPRKLYINPETNAIEIDL